MFRIPAMLLAALCMIAGSMPAIAQTARPGDRAVEDLIEQVKKSEEQFARALDRNVKKGTVRSPNGEVDVDRFLEDFATSIDRLEDRFDDDYSASAELASVMHYATGMDTFIKSQPPTLKGRSEWDEFTSALNALAGAYGSVFPVDESRPARRMNDLEVQQAASSAVEHGSDLRRELSDVFGKEDKAGRQAAEADIESMSKAAKNLKARVDDGKPASGEAAAFVDSVNKLRATIGSRTLTGDAKTASDGIASATSKIQQAFGIKSAVPEEAAPAEAAPAPAAAPAADAPAAEAPAAAPADASTAAAAPATAEPATPAPEADTGTAQ